MLLWFQNHEHAEVSEAKEAWEALFDALEMPATPQSDGTAIPTGRSWCEPDEREKAIRAQRYGSCATCGAPNGQCDTMGIFCMNPRCSTKAPKVASDTMRDRCAQAGYQVCAESRHVSLGDKVRAAILNLPDTPAAALSVQSPANAGQGSDR